MMDFKDLFPFGVWQSDDPDHRWTLDCNENGVKWTERSKGGQTLDRQVNQKHTDDTWRIERPNDTTVLNFLGARPSLVQALLAKNPQPSFLEITAGATDLSAGWNGLFWTVDRFGNLATMEQPGQNPARKKIFHLTRVGDDKQYFQAPKGQLTFDSEGEEGVSAATHSRWLHHPSANSGVTIGRGYDMKLRTATDVKAALVSAGVDDALAQELAAGAGTSGSSADTFVQNNRRRLANITPGQQKRLFVAAYGEKEAAAQDFYKRHAGANAVAFQALNERVREVYVDVIYQGYPSDTQDVIQALVEANNAAGLAAAIRANWPNDQRWTRRAARLGGT